MYRSLQSILQGHVERPETLDAITVDYKGVKVHVYGVVHGVTGGANQDYIQLVNSTIKQAEGPKLCEKSMKMMYKGLDQDVYDWLQIPFHDAYSFALSLSLNPRALWVTVRTMIREKAKRSDFGKHNVHMLGDLVGDALFHTLDPRVRRTYAGLPESEDYLRLNLRRREGNESRTIVFGSHDWEWLSYAERFANIPMRSIHMIEFSVAWALKHGHEVVSLFVGEGHNTDIDWYTRCQKTQTLPDEFQEAADKAIKIAHKAVHEPVAGHYAKYLAGVTLAASTSAFIYCVIAQLLFFMG